MIKLKLTFDRFCLVMEVLQPFAKQRAKNRTEKSFQSVIIELLDKHGSKTYKQNPPATMNLKLWYHQADVLDKVLSIHNETDDLKRAKLTSIQLQLQPQL